jgi:hypothetical protein
LETRPDGDALRHSALLLKSFAGVWVESLQTLLPGAETELITQVVYVSVLLLALWVVKSLLSVIAWAGVRSSNPLISEA